MRTLNDLHEAFAALDAAAPTELSERVTGRSRLRRVGRVIAITAVAGAVWGIAGVMPWAGGGLLRGGAPPSGGGRAGGLADGNDGGIYLPAPGGVEPGR